LSGGLLTKHVGVAGPGFMVGMLGFGFVLTFEFVSWFLFISTLVFEFGFTFDVDFDLVFGFGFGGLLAWTLVSEFLLFGLFFALYQTLFTCFVNEFEGENSIGDAVLEVDHAFNTSIDFRVTHF
jgi:hypothetical protein